MNGEIGTEAAQFPEQEYINGIFVAVYCGIEKFRGYSKEIPIFDTQTFGSPSFSLSNMIFAVQLCM
jgi:hypothetical protein